MQKIITQLERLNAAYPNHRPRFPDKTARVYLELLHSVDPDGAKSHRGIAQ